MRACSLGMTALALALIQFCTLTILGRANSGQPRPISRVFAVLLFGLCPLAIGQGDAIRWYPQFAVLFALFLTLYIVADRPSIRLVAAATLGLALSVNLIAGAVVISLLIYRYLLQRAWCPRFEIVCWALFTAFASFGLWAAWFICQRQWTVLKTQTFGDGWFRALASDVLGVLGGNAIGLGQIWIIAPAAVIVISAFLLNIDRKNLGSPVNFILLNVLSVVTAALLGFSESRAFLYIAPLLSAIVVLFLDRMFASGRRKLAIMAALPVLAISPVAIANLDHTAHPFKRENAIPFANVLEFIRNSQRGNTLVVSTDPVIPWILRKEPRADRSDCASYFADHIACFAPERSYETVILLRGHSSRGEAAAAFGRTADRLSRVLAGKSKVGDAGFGIDEDAKLKTWLSGVPLDRTILRAEVYN